MKLFYIYLKIYSRESLFRKSAYSDQYSEKNTDFLNLKTGKFEKTFVKKKFIYCS